MNFFKTLATIIHTQWRKQNFDELAFPNIAATALMETRPDLHVSLDTIFQWLSTQTTLPPQNLSSTFSDCQLQIFANERFVIEILFWTKSTTNIHQHGFSGAFCVVAGSSLHTEFKFTLKQRFNGGLILGEMTASPPELFRTGRVQPIAPGNRFIHRLFHLDQPSVSLVIRTHKISEFLPQYQYVFHPESSTGIGMDPVSIHLSPIYNRLSMSAQFLAEIRHPSLANFLSEIAKSQDLHTWFKVTAPLLKKLDKEQKEQLLFNAKKQFGPILAPFFPMIVELERIDRLIQARNTITDPELRCFLGVLINSRGSNDVERLLENFFPNEKKGRSLKSHLIKRFTAALPHSPQLTYDIISNINTMSAS